MLWCVSGEKIFSKGFARVKNSLLEADTVSDVCMSLVSLDKLGHG